MDAEIFQQWLDALRSGRIDGAPYAPIRRGLSDGKGGHCAFGVLREIDSSARWCVPAEQYRSVVAMNQFGAPHPTIAEWIEKNIHSAPRRAYAVALPTRKPLTVFDVEWIVSETEQIEAMG